ncbi:phage tail assembly protein [Yersinia enterocolitica]|uniref:Tail protein gpE P2 bacteriophage n=1 Tax=Yersinia enterocolitica TaxID=630 RepID=A0A0T7P9Y4_YEREN|nr:phage tail assembly protein [Yersinia enterocolitica]EKN3692925.1 phage tail assembly protein [Yersinia enterocolitica]EKN4101330.1 phage tail assembly protein [Yersinia enterocolitica]EKN6287797.1 phage tail assembly protein [Yersinia enterocolitica]EKN6292809.1 phage tail assembly protein [Yersinia enterocolitica]EKN6300632.1 phage tail assembly protein [Yersinia enterocolitica]
MNKVTAKTEPATEINENLVVLDTPVKRGDTLITEIEVIRPNAGTLRGVRLADVANSDVDALIIVLPRITYPSLTTTECGRLELPDLVALAGKVIGFLSPKQAE